MLRNAKISALDIIKKHLGEKKYEVLKLEDVDKEYLYATNKANEEFQFSAGKTNYTSHTYLSCNQSYSRTNIPILVI